MHIIIGATSSVEPAGSKTAGSLGATVEARILQLRPPRKRRGPPPDGVNERRSGGSAQDPEGGRVMLLMIPDGHKLPRDLLTGNYKVFLKFAPRVP